MCEGELANVNFTDKLRWSLPWLARYPFWRLQQTFRSVQSEPKIKHVVLLVANHFEPGVGPDAIERMKHWNKLARDTGDSIRDHDSTPFRHTNFYPAEQYDKAVVDMMAELQADGYGEVEIHLHHGVDAPDTADNTRRALIEFRDILASEHKCLSREKGDQTPRYGFVHGNWALANSSGGRFCGVDSEMQILQDTGCYGDFTLPSVPYQSQVPRINAIYECGRPLNTRAPHRSGKNVSVGSTPQLPLIFTGPLVFNWKRRIYGLPVPRVDDGALQENYPLNLDRFYRWCDAHISVEGRPDWVFVKLYSHGFFTWDQDIMIGEQLKRFMGEVLELADRTGKFKIHFASTREAYNMVMAAVDGAEGDPHTYRDYRLTQIMAEKPHGIPSEANSELVIG
jgi:hypothetical protein